MGIQAAMKNQEYLTAMQRVHAPKTDENLDVHSQTSERRHKKKHRASKKEGKRRSLKHQSSVATDMTK